MLEESRYLFLTIVQELFDIITNALSWWESRQVQRPPHALGARGIDGDSLWMLPCYSIVLRASMIRVLMF